MAQETDVPDLPLKEPAVTGTLPLNLASAPSSGPFEAFNEQQVADDQDADATKKSTDDNGELAEGEAREEGDAKDTADDDARSTDAPADDDDDGYLSDDSDDHLEPDCVNSIIALKRFTLTLLVPIARKVEVKRAAQTVAAMLDEWKELLTPDALLTTAYQDLAPMFLSGERYGRLQVTFNQVKDANFVWNQTIRHECVNGDFIDLTWQHPEDARFLRERVLNPTAKEIVIKGVHAEMSAELIRRLLVVSKLVKRGRSIFASGFGFHRIVDPVSSLDTDRIRGLFIPHADDEYRWRTFVEDPTTGKSYLLYYPSLTCDFCGGQHMTRYHDRYVTPRQDNFNNWNVTVKKVHQMNDSLKRIIRDPAIILTSTGGTREEWVCVQAVCEKAQGTHFEQASAHIVSARHKEGLQKESSATRVGTFPQKMISFRKEFMLLAVVVRWGGLEFLLIAAYIPAQAVNRSSFYRDSVEPFLQSLPSFHHILVMGDLNVVEDPDLDRTSHSGSSAENQRLLSCWGNTDLRDAFMHLHPDKREYTFFAKATRSSSRIDRALISQPLLLRLVEAKHVAITNGMTDHWRGIGVVLESADTVKKGPGIWRLRAEQTKKQGVRKIIKKINEESAGEPADRLLGRLPACLRAYSREERKREKATRLHLTKEVERFRVRVSRYPHCQRTGRILLRKEELLEAYEKSHKEKLQTWACVEAELDGEVASGFLSAQIKARKAGTEIREVSRNGSVFSGVKEVLSAATDHFREAFGCSDGGALPVTVDRTMQRQLGEKSKVSLGAPWAEEEAQVYLPPEAIWKRIHKLCHTFVSKGETAEEKRFILWNYKLACTPREDGGLGLICPELRVNSIAIRNVCRLVLMPDSVKKWLAVKAAEFPLGLDTVFAHKSVLDHWVKGSARWKELTEKFWGSPLCKPRTPTNRWEVEQEHLAFNPNIPYSGASPFGNQKGALVLLGIRVGDMIKKAGDGTCVLKGLAELTREMGNRDKAKWALRAFKATPARWKEMVLTKLTGEEIVAKVKLLRSGDGATRNFTYWQIEEVKGDKRHVRAES
ncbi:unnamed protein product [Closterium sp. NIES-64]|nr:unnamed protein product [Closterium sp. NIES-64]